MITITQVVSHNIVVDLIAKIQNLIGANLSGYEKMIQRGTTQCFEKLTEQGIELKWYRFEVTQLTSGAVAIVLYGDEK